MALEKNGDTCIVKGFAREPYMLRNVDGIISCSCPTWRNQTFPADKRTCKHLQKVRGKAVELARVASATPRSTSTGKNISPVRGRGVHDVVESALENSVTGQIETLNAALSAVAQFAMNESCATFPMLKVMLEEAWIHAGSLRDKPPPPPRTHSLPINTCKDQYGVEADVYTLEEFFLLCDCGLVTDKDGEGFVGMRDKRASRGKFRCIDVGQKAIAAPYTHIWWYRKERP